MSTHRPEGRLDALRSIYALKRTDRAGWLRVGVEQPESVGDHSWGTAMLCLEFAAEEGLEPPAAAAMAIVHDLPEARTGDLPYRPDLAETPAGRERRAGKSREEALAMDSLAAGAPAIRELWEEYEAGESATARFVRDMNLLDMCLQAELYAGEQNAPERFAEFLDSSRPRLQTETGRRLFAALEDAFWHTR